MSLPVSFAARIPATRASSMGPLGPPPARIDVSSPPGRPPRPREALRAVVLPPRPPSGPRPRRPRLDVRQAPGRLGARRRAAACVPDRTSSDAGRAPTRRFAAWVLVSRPRGASGHCVSTSARTIVGVPERRVRPTNTATTAAQPTRSVFQARSRGTRSGVDSHQAYAAPTARGPHGPESFHARSRTSPSSRGLPSPGSSASPPACLPSPPFAGVPGHGPSPRPRRSSERVGAIGAMGPAEIGARPGASRRSSATSWARTSTPRSTACSPRAPPRTALVVPRRHAHRRRRRLRRGGELIAPAVRAKDEELASAAVDFLGRIGPDISDRDVRRDLADRLLTLAHAAAARIELRASAAMGAYGLGGVPRS